MSTRRWSHFCISTAASYLTLPQLLAKPLLPAIVPPQSRNNPVTHDPPTDEHLHNCCSTRQRTIAPYKIPATSGKQGTANLPQNSGMHRHCALCKL